MSQRSYEASAESSSSPNVITGEGGQAAQAENAGQEGGHDSRAAAEESAQPTTQPSLTPREQWEREDVDCAPEHFYPTPGEYRGWGMKIKICQTCDGVWFLIEEEDMYKVREQWEDMQEKQYRLVCECLDCGGYEYSFFRQGGRRERCGIYFAEDYTVWAYTKMVAMERVGTESTETMARTRVPVEGPYRFWQVMDRGGRSRRAERGAVARRALMIRSRMIQRVMEVGGDWRDTR